MPTITGTSQPERFQGQRVSATYFRLLGVVPALGRDFHDSEDRVSGPNVVILSNGLWHCRFGADQSIVGKEIRLDDNLYTVAGVMPAYLQQKRAIAVAICLGLRVDSLKRIPSNLKKGARNR